MLDVNDPTPTTPDEDSKQCEQCQQIKLLSEFHRRKNKTDGRMRICGVCYGENLQKTLQRAKEFQIQRELKQQQEREEQARRPTSHRVSLLSQVYHRNV